VSLAVVVKYIPYLTVLKSINSCPVHFTWTVSWCWADKKVGLSECLQFYAPFDRVIVRTI